MFITVYLLSSQMKLINPFMRVIRRDDGARGLMGKSRKGHGTVEDASGYMDRNRERVTTLNKKRDSKQQRICSTIPRNIQLPTESPETSLQRTG
jgi:hypothetical protein